ncbi:MAG: hypothetical protein UY50_C0031G0022 [Parcubacteria group bacterium GW2011_GWA2_49_9]|nr:MAG: hypothetical protein UY50_C0031G0022 [Parcubacteria group bacterium GW2011_GWA2_49_9]
MNSSRHNMKIAESGGLGTLGQYAWDEGIWRIKGTPHLVRCWGAEPMKRVSKHGWPRGWRLDEDPRDEKRIIRPDRLKTMAVGYL